MFSQLRRKWYGVSPSVLCPTISIIPVNVIIGQQISTWTCFSWKLNPRLNYVQLFKLISQLTLDQTWCFTHISYRTKCFALLSDFVCISSQSTACWDSQIVRFWVGAKGLRTTLSAYLLHYLFLLYFSPPLETFRDPKKPQHNRFTARLLMQPACIEVERYLHSLLVVRFFDLWPCRGRGHLWPSRKSSRHARSCCSFHSNCSNAHRIYTSLNRVAAGFSRVLIVWMRRAAYYFSGIVRKSACNKHNMMEKLLMMVMKLFRWTRRESGKAIWVAGGTPKMS